MKKLDTDKKYIKDLFGNFFYNIPEYQRAYVWDDLRVTYLLEDIYEASQKNKEYFLGCMVWNTKKGDKNGLSYEYQDILDGQQRFITLYLLLSVIRDITDIPEIKENIAKQLKQQENIYDNIPSRNRIEFEIREDAAFLEQHVLISPISFDTLKTELKNKNQEKSVKNMISAILCIKKWWNEKEKEIENKLNFQKLIDDFYIYLANKVLILYLATPDELDDAYNLFTILNSRGIQLQQSDILKAQNLRLIDDKVLRKKYAGKWSNYESEFGEVFESFDEFLSAIVDIKVKFRSDETITLSKAFDYMHKRKLLLKGEALFLEVEKYLEHYKAILDWGDKNKEGHYYFQNIVQILGATSTNKFMAPLMHYRQCFGDHKITEFLVKLDNIISVFWILGRNNTETRIFAILKKMDTLLENSIKEGSHKSTAAEELLEDEVLKYDYKHPEVNNVIEIKDFFDLLEEELWGKYSSAKINKVKYLLLKLDLIFGHKLTKINYQTQTSLEHILPRTLKNEDYNISPQEHEEWCHRLGNLVLLDKGKNSSFKNDKYPKKKEKYSDSIESRAYTNKLFMDNDSWGAKEIADNHKKIVGLLKTYYKGNSLDTLLQMQGKNKNYANKKS